MALRKEIVNVLRDAGFLPFEIKQFGAAKTPDGKDQDLDKVINSAPFAAMLESRREWWRKCLSPKAGGGWGMTLKEGKELIKGHYKSTKRRKKVRSVWDFLKVEYKPKDKIKSRRLFDEAVITKSKIVRDLGTYGKKLSLRHAPLSLKRCSLCGGSGRRMNIYGQYQTCLRCSGTGVERRSFI